jgi:hypothetical protein
MAAWLAETDTGLEVPIYEERPVRRWDHLPGTSGVDSVSGKSWGDHGSSDSACRARDMGCGNR